MATYKQNVRKMEAAHQDAFTSKGYEPTNYGAAVDMEGAHPDSSQIMSKLRHPKTGKSANLTTSHDHKSGKISHKWTMKEAMTGKTIKEDIDEALVAKSTLERYRTKAKAKFREKGGINAALEKQDKADAKKKEAQPVKEDLTLVDRVMLDKKPEAAPYIEAIELRCNSLVDEKKQALRKSLFSLDAIAEARKPKPGTPGGSWVARDVAEKFKKEAKEKKQFASAKREIDSLKKKGK